MDLFYKLLNLDNAFTILYSQYVLLALLLISFICIFFVRNNIYALIFMMLVYLLSYPIFVWFQFDFIGTAFIMVYVGAVSVLFLFVLMTLDVNKVVVYQPLFLFKSSNIRYKLFVYHFFLFSSVFLVLLCFLENAEIMNLDRLYDLGDVEFTALSEFNIDSVGLLLYEFYFVELFLFSLILLVAMIGSVVFFRKS